MTSSVDGVSTPLVSRMLGRYLLCHEIASGGMATVFLAKTMGPGGFEKLVALKQIHPHLAKQKSFVDMFLDEARIASRIDHANVCSVFDFGKADDSHYITMEYLVGESLARVHEELLAREDSELLARRTPILLRIIADLCEGLHAAHELQDDRGNSLEVAHRDVSPANLFVTYDGVAKVMDFGVATARERLHETTTGNVRGKCSYMSPEQASAGQADRATDVWALGVVLWEGLTLRRLFHRSQVTETLFAVMTAPIVAPSEANPDLDSRLDPIIMKALERDPTKRYPTTRQFGQELTRILAQSRINVGLAEVSDWMERLFVGGHDQKRRLAEAAIAKDPGPIASSHAVNADESPRSRRGRRSLVLALVFFGLVLAMVFVSTLLLGFGGFLLGSWSATRSNAGRLGAGSAQQQTQSSAPRDGGQDALGHKRPSALVIDPDPEADAGVDGETRPEKADSNGPERDSPRRPAKSKGHVSVSTTSGWAVVYWRGRRLGQTPRRFTLPEGHHVLDVRPYGKIAGRKRINVRVIANKVTTVPIKLSP